MNERPCHGRALRPLSRSSRTSGPLLAAIDFSRLLHGPHGELGLRHTANRPASCSRLLFASSVRRFESNAINCARNFFYTFLSPPPPPLSPSLYRLMRRETGRFVVTLNEWNGIWNRGLKYGFGGEIAWVACFVIYPRRAQPWDLSLSF